MVMTLRRLDDRLFGQNSEEGRRKGWAERMLEWMWTTHKVLKFLIGTAILVVFLILAVPMLNFVYKLSIRLVRWTNEWL